MKIANAKLPDVTLDGVDLTPLLFSNDSPVNHVLNSNYSHTLPTLLFTYLFL